ncbi:MAG TPA: MmgE/PrpD family protein, partial [Solirubrobacteraceae bacterium]|nr:MmgE/PrpD family protein [Solirubrobacteraceae bacterium]
MTASARLAEFVTGLRLDDVPADTREAAKLHALDTLGCGLAAHGLGEGAFVQAATAEVAGAGAATAIGVAGGLAAGEAALLNGTLCHLLDFDDTHPDSVVHVSAAVVPAALAAAETFGATGADLLCALIAGNEVSTRLGMAAGGRFHARGFHPTGVCGVFGATAAVARTRGLSAEQTTHALGIAGSMASGLLEFLADGAKTKPLHPGWAAHAGLAAARLAAHGATGPATVLEGERGFFAAYLHGEAPDLDGQLSDLGMRYETPRIAFKPYA